MPMMLSKTYAAFVAAGAPDADAREAAEEIAAFDARLSRIETDLRLIKWVQGAILACVVIPLIKSFAG